MDKKHFLTLLRKALSNLPKEDIEERIIFYSEMIDDYIEEGLTEEETFRRIGSVNEIASQILGDSPAAKPTAEKKGKKPGVAAIILIILGSPIWLSLLISAFAVIISLYISLWAIIASFWSVFASLVCSCFGCILGGAATLFAGFGLQGAAIIGAGLVFGGLSVFTFFACKAATNATGALTKKFLLAVKNKIRTKEDA